MQRRACSKGIADSLYARPYSCLLLVALVALAWSFGADQMQPSKIFGAQNLVAWPPPKSKGNSALHDTFETWLPETPGVND